MLVGLKLGGDGWLRRRRLRPDLGVLDLGDAGEDAERGHIAHHRHLLRREVDAERPHACSENAAWLSIGEL